MCDRPEEKVNNNARILMFSQRNIYKKYHYRSAFYEFEDIIRQVDSVELLAPKGKKRIAYSNRFANGLAKRLGIVMNPGIPKIKIKKYYDLFFAVCQLPKDLLFVDTIDGWNDYCKTSICWLNEIWVKDILRLERLYKCFFKILSKFNYVILLHNQSVDAVNKAVMAECFYLPPAVDAILFCPYPEPPQRFIDVYSIGRRSEVTHQALLRMVKEKKIYYIYDSICGDEVFDSKQHRILFANTAKRSRYFTVNIGKIDCPNETGGQIEIGPRFFEGAASGTVMIGEAPKNERFKEIFHWPDAIIDIPFNSDNIGKVINELDMNTSRQKQIRKNNVVQSLLKHDWVYRWETVLKTAGLEPFPELIERKKRLKNLSDMIEKV